MYLPFFYLERIKRPDRQHLYKYILTDELLILILALSWLSDRPVVHALSMAFLFLSFYCVYEIGYWENDYLGEKLEAKPTLSEAYYKFRFKMPTVQPWIWATSLAIIGLIFLELSEARTDSLETIWQLSISVLTKVELHLIFWLCLLVFMRVTYWIFNRVNPLTRIWIYPLLQITKFFGFLCIATTNLIGTMLFVSQVIAPSLPYLIYRYFPAVSQFPDRFPYRLSRLLLFLLLLVALLTGIGNPSIVMNWQVFTITLLLLLRTNKELRQVIHQAELRG